MTTEPLLSAVLTPADPARAIDHVNRLASFGTRHTLSESDSASRGITAARNWIIHRLRQLTAAAADRLTIETERFHQSPVPRLPDGATLTNVAATFRGHDPACADRRCYLVAHYDSRCADPLDATTDAPGADDNASGCAVLLEAARALAAAPPTPATVTLLFTAAEEQGLLGAKHHAARLASGELGNVRVAGVLNNDIVGDPSVPGGAPATRKKREKSIRLFSESIETGQKKRPTPHGRAHEPSASDSPSRQLARFIADLARREQTPVQPVLVFRPDRFMRAGDHAPFLQYSYPAVRFVEFDENFDRQHANPCYTKSSDGSPAAPHGDLPQFVDPDYLAGVATLNTAAIYTLAAAPAPPPRAHIRLDTNPYTTTLHWPPSPDPHAIGYEILWRETDQPQWVGVVDVGDVTEATVDLCRDDHFFAVRAYSSDFFRSPAVFAGVEAG